MNWDWNVTGEHILRKRRIKIEKKRWKNSTFYTKNSNSSQKLIRNVSIFSDHELLSILQLFFEKLNIKALFSLTIMDRIFETNSILDCALVHYGKSPISIFFFNNFLPVLTRFSFWEENWALSYNAITFWDFFDIS